MAIRGTPTPGNDLINGDALNNLIDALAGNDTVNGNGGNDTLIGGLGNDQLLGALGNDLLSGGEGNDALSGDNFGSTGNDTLNGGAGNDILNGGLGQDSLAGGVGDDTYANSRGATIIEQANQGNDIVNSSISHTLGANLERLTLVGTANIIGIGNDLNNGILGNSGNNFLRGLAGDDLISGNDGNDTLIGDIGNDTLFGLNGNDVLDGDEGNDSLNGGNGIDLVRVNAVATNIVLTNNSVTGEGVDSLSGIEKAELFLAKSNNIPSNIDASAFTLGSVTLDGGLGSNVLRGGSGNDFLDGKGLNDTLNGGGGADTLKGGAGNDLLIDGSGFDQFFFGTGRAFVSSDLGLDTIDSLDVGSDKIALSKTTFTALESTVGGSLFASDFEVVDSFFEQFTSDAEIVYNFGTGTLTYNSDGSVVVIGGNPGEAIIADLVGEPNISAADFQIVA
jgi:Ca2+-binding RTX toxin-like protein